MELRKFIAQNLRERLNENSLEVFKNNSPESFKSLMSGIEGRLLNKKEAEELQREIESHYNTDGIIKFGLDNNDIRTNMWNYDNPVAEKDVNGVNLKIAEGLTRNRRKTYLLYADGKIIGEFYHVDDIKKIVKYIEDNLVKELPSSKSIE